MRSDILVMRFRAVAERWQRARHVTLPGIAPTVIILFLLNLGHILEVGIELVLLLYNPLTYSTADVIGTFVYRRGIAGIASGIKQTPNLSLGAAVGAAAHRGGERHCEAGE